MSTVLDIISTIKELSHKVSEDFLLLNKDMNDSIIDLYRSGQIENDEILKRICEHANQNVYLAILYDPQTDRSAIKFDLADYEKIKSTLNQGEKDMKTYETPPVDYRKDTEIFPENLDSVAITTKDDSAQTKTASLNTLVAYRDTLNGFASRIESLKQSEIHNVESLFTKIANDTKLMVVNNESIADIAKIAINHLKSIGIGKLEKIASVYDTIHKELVNSGYHVNTEFTKISSLKTNADSEMLKPVVEMANSLEKISGFNEMLDSVKSKLSFINNCIKKNI
jgi:hypothetical protein